MRVVVVGPTLPLGGAHILKLPLLRSVFFLVVVGALPIMGAYV